MIKKISLSIFAFTTGFIFINAVNKTTGGHPTSTGAPGEQTCARTGCHVDASIVNNSPNNKFTFSDAANLYTPGVTYNLSVEITKTDCKKFGFEIVAIDSATQKNIGTWILTEAARTQIISGETPVTDRQYITHTAAGTAAVSSGVGKWNFKWKAPDKPAGTIMFYYVTNSSDANDKNSGDQLHFSNYKIRYSGLSSINKSPEKAKPSIVVNEKNIQIQQASSQIEWLKIFTTDGKLIYENYEIPSNGVIDNNGNIPSNQPILVYIIKTNQGTYKGKFRTN